MTAFYKTLVRRCLWFALVFSFAATTAVAQSSRPNFVIALADDLGYGDLGCYGQSDVETPNLDRFAAEGLRFTDCYSAAANCSPARTGLMTGRTPYRVGVYSAIPFMSPMHVRKEEITIATILRDAGYATCHVGKWHMNGMFNLPGQPQPNDHGFEYWFSTQNNALPNHRNPYNFVRNGIPAGPIEAYAADIVVAEATQWLRDARDKEKPFFLYVCFHEPHEPIATAKKYTDRYSRFEDPSQRAHHGNITQMDVAFGELMRELDRQGLRGSTFVFFTSDNGPALTRFHPYGSAGPLRAKKGHVYDGGIRVPGMLRWPGRTDPGSVSAEPISGVDLLPTLCAIVNAPAPTDRKVDGASFLPVLENQPVERATPLYWQYNLAGSQVKVTIREGDWKILARLDRPYPRSGADMTEQQMEALKTAELTGFELYNVRQDIGESADLAQAEPEKLEAMKQRLVALYHDVRDENLVWPAWKSPRYEASRIEWPEYKALRKPPR